MTERQLLVLNLSFKQKITVFVTKTARTWEHPTGKNKWVLLIRAFDMVGNIFIYLTLQSLAI